MRREITNVISAKTVTLDEAIDLVNEDNGVLEVLRRRTENQFDQISPGGNHMFDLSIDAKRMGLREELVHNLLLKEIVGS